jgi:RNA polymerase sigma factor (sigma-70 family)
MAEVVIGRILPCVGRAVRPRLDRPAGNAAVTPLSRRSLDETSRRVGASIRHVSGQDTPEDVQEALTRAVANGIALDSEPWLKTVARRIAIDRVRRRHEYASGLPAELEKWASDYDGDPEDIVVRAERSEEVRRALENLPPRYRDALLTYAEGESPAGVARRLGLSPKATWTLLSRARTRLRVDLERLGFVPALLAGKTKWKSIFGATAAASAIAVSVALLPAAPESVEEQPSTPIVQAPEAAPAAAVETVQAGVGSPVQDVIGIVEETVDKFVPREIGKVQVASCVRTGQNELELARVPITLTQDQQDPGLVVGLVNALPEPFRKLDVNNC